MIVRILIWSLSDSKATIDELRDSLPELEPPSLWIWNQAGERFGLVVFGEELPPGAAEATELIGREPDVYEEFDELELLPGRSKFTG
ncbi:MAG: hypothetical protein ACRDQT_09470 [Gaiellaceae bacterium]